MKSATVGAHCIEGDQLPADCEGDWSVGSSVLTNEVIWDGVIKKGVLRLLATPLEQAKQRRPSACTYRRRTSERDAASRRGVTTD